MGYSSSESRVRVDIFKSSGKWYSTASVDMNLSYKGLIHDCVLEACENEFKNPNGQWGLTVSPRDWLRNNGGYLVCIEPYHEHSHPVMITDNHIKE